MNTPGIKNKFKRFSLPGNDYFLIILLWSVLTVINIDKAFHIDDTFHLEAAESIRNNPLKPMTGLINWGDVPTPLHHYNQPPLFFYCIALVSGVFGTNEVILHLLLSLFTFLCLFFFYRISRILLLQKVRILLILFAFCPALIINQNVMTDVPVLALILGSAYFLFKANNSRKMIDYSLSAFLLGAGLLIKYSLLPLMVVLILVILARRDYKSLFVLFIPMFMLFIWSLWNYYDFGAIHILGRSGGSVHIRDFWTFMACLGSVSAFTASVVCGLLPYKIFRRIVYFIPVIFIISVILFINNLIPENQFSEYLNFSFIINGIIISTTLVISLLSDFKIMGIRKFITSDVFILLLYIGSLSAFIIIFAPFIATRHILLVIPFILLLGHKLINKAPPGINRLSIAASVVLGLALGISDWKYADYYRQMAADINLPGNKNVWTAGHWGWQWYSKKNGMKQYDMNQSEVKEGDYFVYPGDIAKQNIGKNIHLAIIGKKWQEATFLTLFSGHDHASLYESYIDKPPWRLSKRPVDTIYICRIEIQRKPQ